MTAVVIMVVTMQGKGRGPANDLCQEHARRHGESRKETCLQQRIVKSSPHNKQQFVCVENSCSCRDDGINGNCPEGGVAARKIPHE